jgi:hypothetical protein
MILPRHAIKINLVQMPPKSVWPLLGLLAVTFLSRIPFRAHIPYGLDSIQFVLGVENYDVRLHQPHPPGYFLFVMMGKIVQPIFHDPNSGFIFLNMLFSSLSVYMVFLLAREIFGEGSTLISASLMSSSPLFWFHGEVALSNMADCFFVCLVALLSWKNLNGNYRLIYLSSFALGIAGGVRQNTLVFLLPLWFVSIRKSGPKRVILSGILLALTIAIWYFPMARLSGGFAAYQMAVRDHWLNSNWHGFTLSWLPFNMICVGYFVLLGAGLGCMFLLLGTLFYFDATNLNGILNDKRAQFFLAWVIPPLAFFIVIYSHPFQTGHSLIYLPAFLILLPPSVQLSCTQIAELLKSDRTRPQEEKRAKQFGGRGIAVTLRQMIEQRKRTAHAILGPTLPLPCGGAFTFAGLFLYFLVGCNLFTFLSLDTAVSQRAIRKYETRVSEMVSVIQTQCSPEDTILLAYDFMFLGFRDFMFHLPEYHTYQPKLYTLAGDSLLFTGFRKKTQLINSIRIPPTTKSFILNADEFAKNPQLIHGIHLENFSSDHFLKTPSGLQFFRGNVRDLPKFFPQIQFTYQ